MVATQIPPTSLWLHTLIRDVDLTQHALGAYTSDGRIIDHDGSEPVNHDSWMSKISTK